MVLELRDNDKDKYHVHFKVSLKCLKNEKFVITYYIMLPIFSSTKVTCLLKHLCDMQ